jgi:penicillin-binding protein 2
MNPDERSRRARVLSVLLLAAATIFLVRLCWLQVAMGSHYRALSEDNHIRRVVSFAPRGEMYDRSGTLLVASRPSYTISVIPTEAPDPDSVLRTLSRIARLPLLEMRTAYEANYLSRYSPVRVARDVPFETIARIEERVLDLPAVFYEVEPVRSYPEGGLGAHLFGTVGEVGEGELDSLKPAGYVPGSVIGRCGVEAAYERFVRGVDGARFFEVSATGQVLGSSPDYPDIDPVPGSELLLTVDWPVQVAAERALAGRTGAVVALDPNTGGVLAMASAPGFDGNTLAGYVRPRLWAELSADTSHPLVNRAVSGIYPPGSTMKIATAGAVLSRGLIGPKQRLKPCYGSYRFGRRVFGCWKPGGHGALTVRDAIVQSCDVFFYQCGLKLGVDLWAETMRDCGFGSETGVDVPGEASGLIPDGEYYDRRYGERGWTRGLVLNLAIGQGECLVTPLQLARFAAAVADGGRLHNPHTVSAVVPVAGDTVWTEVESGARLPFADSTVALLHDAMVGVVNEPKGTGRAARLPGVIVAGKTGTAENPHGEDHALFIAFAPAENPTIALAVVVENAGHGGSVAAPIARDILAAHFRLYDPLAVADSTGED